MTPSLLVLAQAKTEVENFPLGYQIACILLTGVFLLTFSIARNPRGWRRLFQSKFSKTSELSVNKNKRIDEMIKKHGISISMIFLVGAVTCFVLGATYRYRIKAKQETRDEQFQRMDLERFKAGAPASEGRKYEPEPKQRR